MDNNTPKLNCAKRGFIQIPMILVILMLGAVATSGGYYAFQHNKNADVVKEVLGSEIVSSSEKINAEHSEATTSSLVSSGLKLTNVSGIKWDNAPDVSEAPSNSVQDYISQLTAMKETVDELNSGEADVKTKIVSTETNVSNLRIEKLKTLSTSSSLDSINKAYEALIDIEEIRKKNINLVLGSSLMDTLFYSMEFESAIKSLKSGNPKDGLVTAQKLISTYNVRFEGLKKQSLLAVETAIAENKAYAQEFLLRFDSTMSLANRYSELTQMLEEIQQARKDLESASTVTVSSSYYVQPAQVMTQTQSLTSVSSCKFPTSKYALIPGRGWVAVKQCQNGTYIEASKYTPDTSNMTQQQICDARKAGQLSGGAYISDSQPDPACK